MLAVLRRERDVLECVRVLADHPGLDPDLVSGGGTPLTLAHRAYRMDCAEVIERAVRALASGVELGYLCA